LIEGDSRYAVLFEDMGLEEINIVRGIPPTEFKFTKEEIEAMNCKPRWIKSLEEPEDNKPWALSKSVFRDFKEDNPELIGQCFDIDYEYVKAKVEYLIKNPEDRAKVREMLRNNYGPILSAYKY
jgi:hypothetical protein